MKTYVKLITDTGKVPVSLMHFIDLPLGTRFKYLADDSTIWVILDRSGCGLIASWNGVETPVNDQHICSAAETREELLMMIVAVVED